MHPLGAHQEWHSTTTVSEKILVIPGYQGLEGVSPSWCLYLEALNAEMSHVTSQ